MRKQYKFIKHSKTDRYKELTNKTMLNIAAFNVDIYGILRNLIEFILLHCFPNLLCCARKFEKGLFLCGYDRISAMQIIGSVQIVTGVTSVVPTFFTALRFLFVSFAWLYCYFCFIR